MGSLTMPRRLIRPSWWWQHHPNLVAYAILALVAVAALAREEQLRSRESDHSRKAVAAIRAQAMDLCVATNQGRIEGNKRAQALRRSLNVDSTILHEAALFQRRMGDKQAARSLQRRADQFTRIATTLANLPPIDCKS
jgi:hypothetical protein